MTLWLGMDREDGLAVSDIEHLRQSVRDILLTPLGSRLARREYGSLLASLIDRPQDPALKLQIMSAVYMALTRWEPRLLLNSMQITREANGTMVVELVGQRDNGQPLSFTVTTGVPNGGY